MRYRDMETFLEMDGWGYEIELWDREIWDRDMRCGGLEVKR